MTAHMGWDATRLCLAATALLAGCGVEPAADLTQRPSGSELHSRGPGHQSRIYYQFIDEQNRVRFVERLADVPEHWRERAGFVELDSPPPLSPADARRTRERSAGGSVATSRAPDAPAVTLYFADWCPYCRKAKAHLDRRGIPFELRDVEVPAARAEMIASSGQSGIPVLDVGGRIMTGYDAAHLDAFLDSAGFR